ncbi:MAG TPA: glutathione S-transferase family protein [Verrucomicrobiae bacterium]|nr:glutathione S-transferase family protein [Verrucomicrobiae bacterium]
MITLIQLPWSPFCISIRRILDEHRIPYRVKNVRGHMRDDVIRATNGRAYTVPCLIDGRTAVADFTDFGQEVARHIDRKYKLGLFPRDKEGIQSILARYIENDLEGIGFKIDDSYVIPTLPLVERVMLTRYKERKFGKGCVQQWTKDRAKMIRQFADLLAPMDNMLASSEFLLGTKPLFVDYDLYGILGNYLYCGKTKLPRLKNLQRWHRAMARR